MDAWKEKTNLWTPQEIEILRRMRKRGATRQQMAEKLGRTVAAVQGKLIGLGLSDSTPSYRIGDDRREEFIDDWKANVSTTVMGEKYRVSKECIHATSKRFGLEPRSNHNGVRPEKYRIEITPWPEDVKFRDHDDTILGRTGGRHIRGEA